MTLHAGSRLGPYEISAEIGAGGMGIVYRARDTRLDRDVAIKVLPEAFAHDPERVARFQREAKVLASLNHPNIGGIYGLEEAPGVTALVLEFVEGPTLADRIAQRPIPLNEALPIARQMAEALEAAHEHGVIHRDLKPANIKVREDGTVKVLDFGLAKALGPAEGRDFGSAGSEDQAYIATHSPTLSLAATQAGMILGTAAYMAPEQARGKVVDKRSDIWAFGCVLYEMLTGKRPFEGEDVSVTLAAVLMREPDWSVVPAHLPPAIRTLLRRCLEKDRRKRMADVSTALVLIDEAPSLTAPAPQDHASIQQEQEAHRQQVDAAVSATRSEMARSMRRRVALVSVVVAVICAIAATATWWLTRPVPLRPVRTEITTAGATALIIQGTDRDLAITPDGSRVIVR